MIKLGIPFFLTAKGSFSIGSLMLIFVVMLKEVKDG
jgi:hypothetical protein